MVGPVSEAEHAAFARKVQAGVVLLVGVSCGLVALGAGATLVQTGIVVAAGLPVGGAIAWWVVPTDGSPVHRRSRRVREDPFADGGGEHGEDGERDSGR